MRCADMPLVGRDDVNGVGQLWRRRRPRNFAHSLHRNVLVPGDQAGAQLGLEIQQMRTGLLPRLLGGADLQGVTQLRRQAFARGSDPVSDSSTARSVG